MAERNIETISEESDMAAVPDVEDMLLEAIRERLQAMPYGELDAFLAVLPEGFPTPGMASPEREWLMETLWYFFHVPATGDR